MKSLLEQINEFLTNFYSITTVTSVELTQEIDNDIWGHFDLEVILI